MTMVFVVLNVLQSMYGTFQPDYFQADLISLILGTVFLFIARADKSVHLGKIKRELNPNIYNRSVAIWQLSIEVVQSWAIFLI